MLTYKLITMHFRILRHAGVSETDRSLSMHCFSVDAPCPLVKYWVEHLLSS